MGRAGRLSVWFCAGVCVGVLLVSVPQGVTLRAFAQVAATTSQRAGVPVPGSPTATSPEVGGGEGFGDTATTTEADSEKNPESVATTTATTTGTSVQSATSSPDERPEGLSGEFDEDGGEDGGGSAAALSSFTATPPTPPRYGHDFSVEPMWTTDNSNDFSWDQEEEVFRVHLENASPEHTPNRYAALPIDLNPQQSFSVSADVFIENIDEDGLVTFGLYAHDLARGHAPQVDVQSMSTVNLSLLGLSGKQRHQQLAIVTENGVNHSQGGLESPGFLLDTWYTFSFSYDADAGRVEAAVTERATGQVYTSYVREVPDSFSPHMRYLGVSAYPEGEAGTTFAAGDRPEGSSDFLVDNVVVYGAPFSSGGEEEPDPDAAPSVLFLPGFQGSYLFTKSLVEDQRWTPILNASADISALAMDAQGKTVEQIYTKSVIKSEGGLDVYASLAGILDNLAATGTIASWRAFPYDWRYDVFDIVEDGTVLADEERVYPVEVLETLAEEAETGGVTIIAHSNGGLLAKALLDRLAEEGKEELVDKLVMIGSPQIGAPKAVMGMLHGYEQAIALEFLNRKITIASAGLMRHSALNMPGAYSLLPSERLVGEEDIVTFADDEVVASYRSAYGDAIDSYQELEEFLLGTQDGRVQPGEEETELPAVLNTELLARAALNHEYFESWEAPEGIGVVSIVGVGAPTPEAFRYKEENRTTCVVGLACTTEPVLDYEVTMSYAGDGTVPSESAGYYGDTYYLDLQSFNTENGLNKRHAEMSGLEPVTALVENLLAGTTTLPAYISSNMPKFDTTGVRVSTHSPVTFVVTDSGGRRSGVVISDDGGEEVLEEIPGSYVIETSESIYVGLPDGSAVEIALTGTGDGTFDLEVATTEDGEVADAVRYENVSVSSSTIAAAALSDTGAITAFAVDTDGDGSDDVDVLADAGNDEDTAAAEVASGGGGYTKEPTEAEEARELTIVTEEEVADAQQTISLLYRRGHLSQEQYESFLAFFWRLESTDLVE